ncbi:MAG: photosystem II protein Y [Xenococcaceae cyanobacterium]
MDLRLLIVLLPLVVALVWVGFNIGASALKQGQDFLDKES